MQTEPTKRQGCLIFMAMSFGALPLLLGILLVIGHLKKDVLSYSGEIETDVYKLKSGSGLRKEEYLKIKVKNVPQLRYDFTEKSMERYLAIMEFSDSLLVANLQE